MAAVKKTVGGRKEKEVDPLNVPHGVDGSTFFAPSIPEEVKAAVPLFHQFPAPLLKGIISKILEFIAAPDSFTFDPISLGNEVDQDEVATVMTATYITIRTAIRNKIKISNIKESLLAMHFPAEFTEGLCRAISKSRMAVESAVVENRIAFPKLEKLKWRIDVVISSGVLTRVMRPNIMFQLVLQNGEVKTFEISIEQFNQLRYSVAKVLHDMQTLERHPIMKIVNEFKRREEEDYNN